jgi:hypothetical protein
MKNGKWIDHIYPPTSPEEVTKFVKLWEVVNGITFNDTIEDDVRWRWTADGEYTAKSAYQIQFVGTFSKIRITPIWKARVESKCRFFAWTLMHKKILMASNLLKRGWTDETDCKFCGVALETPIHLCKDCPFTKQVWGIIKQWFNLAATDSVSDAGSLHGYWWKCRRRFGKNERRNIDGIFIYFWWNIWKERNRRCFQQKLLNPTQVATLCKDDIMQHRMAMAPTADDH